jgi:ubiquinone/menaquinone biosynthesis C-methylase UbiE
MRQNNEGEKMPKTEQYIEKLLVSNPLMEPAYKDSIQALKLPQGSRGLDVGCGIGLQAVLLAEAVGPEGHITGLDIVPEFLAYAEKMIQREGLSDRISFENGDMNALPFDDNTFDWLWSANCVGYPVREPLPLLNELARVVKPGGKISILIYASQMLLPGYPMLEARLNATSIGIAPFTVDMKPETHHMRVLGWYREAGLKNPSVRTFTKDVQAPIDKETRAALAALFDMRWGGTNPEVSPEDWEQFQRLTRWDSPKYILDLPDYYAFITVSLFCGTIV